jgi:hypothetical protein
VDHEFELFFKVDDLVKILGVGHFGGELLLLRHFVTDIRTMYIELVLG